MPTFNAVHVFPSALFRKYIPFMKEDSALRNTCWLIVTLRSVRTLMPYLRQAEGDGPGAHAGVLLQGEHVRAGYVVHGNVSAQR